MEKEKPKKLRLTVQKGRFSGFIPSKTIISLSKEDIDNLARIFNEKADKRRNR